MGITQSAEAPDSPDEFDLTLDVELSPGAIAPAYSKTGSGAFTIYAPHDLSLDYGRWTLLNTGLTFSLPFMLVISVDSVDPLLLVHRTVLDCESEELCLWLCYWPGCPPVISEDMAPMKVRRGDPIARGLVLPIARPEFRLYEAATERV